MAFTPVAVWGDPSTPFQLAGKSPIERRPTTDQLWEYANPHLGFYGFLRVANPRIVRRVGVGLMDLSDRRWRDTYDERVHPCKAADDAIADEAADVGCKL